MIRLFIFFLIMAVCPWMTGMLLSGKRPAAEGWPPCFCFLAGTVCMWAVYELLAVPAVMLQLPLHVLTGLWSAFLLAAACLFLIRCRRPDFRKRALLSPAAWRERAVRADEESRTGGNAGLSGRVLIGALLLTACLLAGWQCRQYFEKQHVDDDDSRFIAVAVSAWQHDTMLLDNPATGEPVPRAEGEVTKEVTSPWPLYLASLASIIGIHPTILAHTILPVCLLLLRYMAVWAAGWLLFAGDGGKWRELEQRAWFLLFAVVGTQYFGGSVYSASAFALCRIWQGKAVLAAFVLPWILMVTFGMELRGRCGPDLRLLMITAAAACLVSGMGIMMSGALIGTYALWHGWRRRDPRQALRVLACAWPCAVCGLLYLYLR